MTIWHALDSSAVISALHTTSMGLDDQAVQERLQQDGLNVLPRKDPPSAWQQFIQQLYNPLIGILACAALMKVALQQWGDFFAIVFVILFNTVLGCVQERKAENSLKELRKLNSSKATVMRNGIAQEIDSANLVRGDCLLLESGMKVSADARIIESHLLEVDESLLTGESVPVSKSAEYICPISKGVAEQSNMVFSGTIITRGRAKAIVVTTGAFTYLSRIAKLTIETVPPTSPLKDRLERFGKSISFLTLGLMVVILALGLQQGFLLSELIMTCVSLTVSAVPEGLPMAVTIVLSVGLLAMARKRAVVRKLPTIETLGCTTVICTDKTGTLTHNRMEVVSSVIGCVQEPHVASESLMWASRIAKYASEVRETSENGVIGDPVDAALFHFSEKHLLKEKPWQKEIVIPFESDHRMMAAKIIRMDAEFLLYKGSYEVIVPLCSTMYRGDFVEPIDLEEVDRQFQEISARGLRILALAFSSNGAQSDLTFVGLLGLEDPIRIEAKPSIAACQQAGIRVVMITGDHKSTALAIAKTVELSSQPRVLTGPELDVMDDRELRNVVDSITIFARVAPHHKLRIVQNLQALGHVVAMTGDGVNDAPSLKAADIGIAMGSGTDVAKEASSMVILDNNFATIVQAIRQGRVIFKSLQQMAAYLLTTCFGGVLTIAGSILLALPLPLLPLQLLWINLITDGTTTIPLVLEGEHGDVMNSPPRPKKAPLLSSIIIVRAMVASLVMTIGTIGLFTECLFVEKVSLRYAQTMAFSTLAFFQIFNAFNSRSLRRSLFFNYASLKKLPFFQNKWFLLVTGGCCLLQVAAVELPFLQSFLSTCALSYIDWAKVVVVSCTVVIASELHKLITHQK